MLTIAIERRHQHWRRQFPLALALAVSIAGCTDQRAFDASDGQLTLHVADAALAAGAPDLASNVADSILASHPQNVAALATKGNALYMEGQFKAAEQAYRDILAIDPDSVAGELGLGRILLQADLPAAEAAFLRALQGEPHNVAALSDLGIALDLQGRPTEAQRAYRQALDIAPDDAATLACLGLSLALSGDAGTSVRILRPLASDPGAPPRVRDDLAVALALAGDTPGAERTLRTELSQPEIATAIVDYRALVTPGEAPVLVALAGLGPTSAGPIPVVRHALPEGPSVASAPIIPVRVATAASTEKLGANLSPATEQPGSSAAALPGEPSPVHSMPDTSAPSTGELQSQKLSVAARPTQPPAPFETAVASATGVTETQRSSPASTPEVVRPIVAIRSDSDALWRAADSVPARSAAPTPGWVAEFGADVATAFTAGESRELSDGAMLAVAPPTDLPVTGMWSGLGESWPPALAPLSLASVARAIAAVAPAAYAETEKKPVHGAGSAVPRQQPYVQVAAAGSQQAARSEWERLRAKLPDMMNGRAPTIVQADVNGKMFWRLRTSGFATLTEANQFCGRMQAAGSGCWTVLAAPPG